MQTQLPILNLSKHNERHQLENDKLSESETSSLNSWSTFSNFVKNYATVQYSTQKAECGGLLVARRLSNGYVDVRICYDRDFVLFCADSPYSILPPVNIRQMVFEMSEILVKFPHRYHSSNNAHGLSTMPPVYSTNFIPA